MTTTRYFILFYEVELKNGFVFWNMCLIICIFLYLLTIIKILEITTFGHLLNTIA